jgi:hypothetical protein
MRLAMKMTTALLLIHCVASPSSPLASYKEYELGQDYSIVFNRSSKDLSFHCSHLINKALGDQQCTYQDEKPEIIAGIPLKEFRLSYFGEKPSMIVCRFDSIRFGGL